MSSADLSVTREKMHMSKNIQAIAMKAPNIVVPPHPEWPIRSKEEKNALKEKIEALLKQQDAKLVAHYYTDGDLQELAEETGGCVSDSLEMARYGTQQKEQTLVVCGVRFMGETAKILNPEKRILMPDLNATCSLDEGCPADEFEQFCDRHPNHTVVVYANTSARVKARSDWVVTSGIALPVIRHLSESIPNSRIFVMHTYKMSPAQSVRMLLLI